MNTVYLLPEFIYMPVANLRCFHFLPFIMTSKCNGYYY